MTKQYSIIGSGFIGQYLHANLNGCLYNRKTISTLPEQKHDVIVITAPTGNRLQVNADPASDLTDCDNLVSWIDKCEYNHLVHVSTVDVYHTRSSKCELPVDTPPEALYGHNRWLLEQRLQMLPRCHTVRLPSLVDLSIQKNILFDLKNNIWLDKINLNSTIQWYLLTRLAHDIPWMLAQDQTFENLVSEPIKTLDIVTLYRPKLVEQLEKNTNKNNLTYDVRSSNGQYLIPVQEIWSGFGKYFSC
jgi:hypothetical protein